MTALTPSSAPHPPTTGGDRAHEGVEADALAALVGSRICHDLVNPVGAIANGVELLQMGGAGPEAPELQLVAGSVAQTAARLKFFRIAFGIASPGQTLAAAEARAVLSACHAGGRLLPSWDVASDCPRGEARIAFLLLLCVEAALPRGGEVRVAAEAGDWRIEAAGQRVTADPALWALLDGRPFPGTLRPGEVQFALAPRAAAAFGRRIAATAGETTIRIDF
ncbi:MAG: histidine phosphotransferase family protein [Rhodobacteraceae bacterium]|nr:histidine phosphotransferase family protein [Paracoccaceae bacterium]